MENSKYLSEDYQFEEDIRKKCTKCGEINKNEANYCKKCGISIKNIICPVCGISSKFDQHYCIGCKSILQNIKGGIR